MFFVVSWVFLIAAAVWTERRQSYVLKKAPDWGRRGDSVC